MNIKTDFFGKLTYLLVALVLFLPSWGVAETRFVNCDSGRSIGEALKTLSPGDTLLVSGTCRENVEVGGETGQFDGITLDGQGTATISGPDPAVNTLQLTSVRGVTVKGFRITGGRDGLIISSGQRVGIENTTIEQVGRQGMQVQRGTTMAHIMNSVIQNNPSHGLVVNENSYLRIGFATGVGSSEGDTGPNVIQGNGGHGVYIQRASLARIYQNTIRNNRQNGVNVEKLSYAEIASNIIEGNRRNGIQATQNSGVHLGTDTGTGNENRPNSTGTSAPNGKYGIEVSLGAYADGRLGTLTGVWGAQPTAISTVDPGQYSLNP
ncbi:MAG: hypothetical protein A3G20_00045 [Acidobacteria bacterium RIFCSPLOWO2_12_FULL_59_11]|nr:MAG: hypothetical protein A3G20_00045 [Acidobacteria bacterium RIFCSPLOWO2_12_FULL_59_11]